MGGAGKAQPRKSMLNCTTSGHDGGRVASHSIPPDPPRETDADGTDTRGKGGLEWGILGASSAAKNSEIGIGIGATNQPLVGLWLAVRVSASRPPVYPHRPSFRLSVECFRRVNSGGECGAPRGRGGGTHGVRGASGSGPARGPGFPSDLCPLRAPLAPCFHPPETLQCSVCVISADISLGLALDDLSRCPSTDRQNTCGRRWLGAPKCDSPRVLFPEFCLGFSNPV